MRFKNSSRAQIRVLMSQSWHRPGSRYPAKVIVRFCNRKVVNFCLEHRSTLQQKAYQQMRLNLRFYESLCKANEESLRIAKSLKQEGKIHNYYLRNGFVKIVIVENGPPTKISHPNMLRYRFGVIPERTWYAFLIQ